MKLMPRKKLITAIVAICLFAAVVPSFLIQRSSEKELRVLKVKLSELKALTNEYRSLKAGIDAVEQKASLTKADGAAQAMDAMVSSLGIRGKMKSVKAAGGRDIKGDMTEESVDARLEKVTMNEMVNLFHRIEEAPMILSLKRVNMKKSFENPELLDISMTVSLFTKK